MSKLSDDFVVFTDHNKDANFESFTTFYIPDSVMVIGSSEKPEFWSATEADDIVSTLVSGMEGRGYTRASDKESADLGLQVSFVKNVNYFTNYPYPVVYSYSVGSLLVELVNLKAPLPKSADAKLPVLWTAYMTGLLSGSDKVNIELSTRAIEQAFVQSPYLKK